MDKDKLDKGKVDEAAGARPCRTTADTTRGSADRSHRLLGLGHH